MIVVAATIYTVVAIPFAMVATCAFITGARADEKQGKCDATGEWLSGAGGGADFIPHGEKN